MKEEEPIPSTGSGSSGSSSSYFSVSNICINVRLYKNTDRAAAKKTKRAKKHVIR